MRKINSATIEDYKALLVLVNEFEFDNQTAYQSMNNIDQNKVKADNKKYLKKYLQDKYCNYFVCWQNKEIIGYVFVSIDDTYKGDGYINELYILPENRRKGIASKLITLGLKWLKKSKCQNICITVNRKNKYALKLFKKFGFEIYKDSYVSMKLDL